MCRLPINSFLLGALLVSACSAADPSRPNIVLVVADDLGYGDLGCYGSKTVHTPNLDRFAAQGLRLTDCYAGHANCSPSRAALLTGRTPSRFGVRDAIIDGSPMHMPQSERTIATLLKNAGYATCHVGKWHLNGRLNDSSQPQPNDHGFDHWFATHNNALPNHHNPDNFIRNGKPVGPLKGYASQIVVDESIRWLTQQRDQARPFFLYVCFHEPHEPIATDPKYRQQYPSEDPSFSAYYGNITQMDDAFGRLMQVLDEQQLANETLVWFTSDNGPAITFAHPHGSAGPLRGKKGFLEEGGIRVPGIVRWPGHVAPARVAADAVSGVDFLPTICDLTGIPSLPDRKLDGQSIRPVLQGEPMTRTQPLYWQFDRAEGTSNVAMRIGDWKILGELEPRIPRDVFDITDASEQQLKQRRLGRCWLYDLRNDIGESTDLATKEPARIAAMKSQLAAALREVQRESPTWPAWKFTSQEAQRIVWPEYAQKKLVRSRRSRLLRFAIPCAVVGFLSVLLVIVARRNRKPSDVGPDGTQEQLRSD